MREVEIDRLYLIDIETICPNMSNELREVWPKRMWYSESSSEHLITREGGGGRGERKHCSLIGPFPIKPVCNPTYDRVGDSGVLYHLVGEHGVSEFSTSARKSVVVFEKKQAYFVPDNCSLSAT